VYQQPDEAQGPQVGLDAMSTPLIGAGRAPLPAAPGKPLRYDTESQSHGTANIFMAFAPCAGPRCPKVTEPRTQVEGAHVLHELVEQHAPHAEKMRLVLDNRTTHTHAALYEVFDPSEAKRIADTCAMHYPPQQGRDGTQPSESPMLGGPYRGDSHTDPQGPGMESRKERATHQSPLAVYARGRMRKTAQTVPDNFKVTKH
jgi:DDE superfamily endonuclease